VRRFPVTPARAGRLALALVTFAACGGEERPPAPAVPGAARDSVAAPAETFTRDSVASPIESVGGLQARRTEVLGIVADLLSAVREEGTLTVAVRFRNAGSDSLSFTLSMEGAGAGPRLTAGGRTWPLAREPDGDPAAPARFEASLAPGGSRLWRASFVAPPRSVHAFDLELPGVLPFADVPIRDDDP